MYGWCWVRLLCKVIYKSVCLKLAIHFHHCQVLLNFSFCSHMHMHFDHTYMYSSAILYLPLKTMKILYDCIVCIIVRCKLCQNGLLP